MGRTNANGRALGERLAFDDTLALDGRHVGGPPRAGVHEEPDDEPDDAGDHEDQPDRRQVDARDRVGHRVTQNGAHGDEEDAASDGHARGLSRWATCLHPSGRLYDGAMSTTALT